MFPRHQGGNVFRGVDDLVERNEGVEIGESHVGARDGVAGGHDVLAEARGFDAIGDGIADEAEHRLKRQRRGGDGLRQRAAGQRDQSARRHRGRRAALGLTAADLGREGPARRDEDTDESAREHRSRHILLGPAHRLGHADHGAGEGGAGAGGRGGDDDAHGTLHLHQRRHVEHDTVQCAAIEQAPGVEQGFETSALVAEHAVLVGRAREAARDRASQNAHDADHAVDDLAFREIAARHLIPSGEFPERRVFFAVVREHLGATREGHTQVFARRHGQHGRESLHGGRPHTRRGNKVRRFDLDDLRRAAVVHDDLVGLDRDDRPLGLPDQRLVIPAVHAHRDAVEADDFHHAAAGRDRDERVLLARIAEGEAVGVGMRVADIDGFDADRDACVGQCLRGVGEAFVVGLPAEQATEEAHVRALAFVRQRQGALAIKFDEDVGDVAVHEIAGEPTDAERGGAVGTGGPAHDGADHVVEDADGVHGGEGKGAE